MRRLLLFITSWEWLVLLLLLPFIVFGGKNGALVILILPVFWLVRKAAVGRFFPNTPYDAALLLLAASILFSFMATFDIAMSFPKIAGLLLGVALYFAAVAHTQLNDKGQWHITEATILAGTGMALFALFFTRWPSPFQRLNQLNNLIPQTFARLPGAPDGFINNNEIAGVLVWISPLLLSVLIGFRVTPWAKKRYSAWLIFLILAVCLAITLAVLAATRSRGGYLAFVAAVLVMFATSFRWGRWVLIGGMILGGWLFFMYGEAFWWEYVSLADAETLGLTARFELWSAAVQAISDFPLTGVSMNGFRQLVHILYPLMQVSIERDIGHSHNQLLQAGLDLGIPGLIAYLSLWLLSAALLWQQFHKAQVMEPADRVLLTGVTGSLAAGWVFGILDAIALGARPGFIWWLLLALVAALVTNVNRPMDIDSHLSDAQPAV